jgi:hypothetical protein
MSRTFSAHKDWSKISCVAEIIEPKARSREEFIQECKAGAFDGVVAAFRTVGSVAITGRIDEDLVPILPRSLNFIVHNGMELTDFYPYRLIFGELDLKKAVADFCII